MIVVHEGGVRPVVHRPRAQLRAVEAQPLQQRAIARVRRLRLSHGRSPAAAYRTRAPPRTRHGQSGNCHNAAGILRRDPHGPQDQRQVLLQHAVDGGVEAARLGRWRTSPRMRRDSRKPPPSSTCTRTTRSPGGTSSTAGEGAAAQLEREEVAGDAAGDRLLQREGPVDPDADRAHAERMPEGHFQARRRRCRRRDGAWGRPRRASPAAAAAPPRRRRSATRHAAMAASAAPAQSVHPADHDVAGGCGRGAGRRRGRRPPPIAAGGAPAVRPARPRCPPRGAGRARSGRRATWRGSARGSYSTSAGRSGTSRAPAGSLTTRAMTPGTDGASNARRPVSARYSTAPSEKTSLRPSISRSRGLLGGHVRRRAEEVAGRGEVRGVDLARCRSPSAWARRRAGP